jgi:hypothetical protein
MTRTSGVATTPAGTGGCARGAIASCDCPTTSWSAAEIYRSTGSSKRFQYRDGFGRNRPHPTLADARATFSRSTGEGRREIPRPWNGRGWPGEAGSGEGGAATPASRHYGDMIPIPQIPAPLRRECATGEACAAGIGRTRRSAASDRGPSGPHAGWKPALPVAHIRLILAPIRTACFLLPGHNHICVWPSGVLTDAGRVALAVRWFRKP